MHKIYYLLLLSFCFLIPKTSLLAQNYADAKLLARTAAFEMMGKISPLTGHNPSVMLKSVKFNKAKLEYMIDFASLWLASPCYFCDEQEFKIEGILHVKQGGEVISYKPYAKNSAVQDAAFWDQTVNSGAALIGQLLIHLTKDHSEILLHNPTASPITIGLSIREGGYWSTTVASGATYALSSPSCKIKYNNAPQTVEPKELALTNGIYRLSGDESIIEKGSNVEQYYDNNQIDRSMCNTTNTYAVIVGISRYQSGNNLYQADDDAIKFHALMTKRYPLANSILLLDDDATKTNVLAAMENLYKRANKNDNIIFYFSGHGSPGSFVIHDNSYFNTLTHDEVKSAFKKSKAGTKIIFSDSCFSGTFGNKDNADAQATKIATDNEVITFLSSRSNETSIENNKIGGFFTYFLIWGMKGKADINKDRKITARELFEYTSHHVKDVSGKTQNPVMWGKFEDSTAMICW